jgi:hypothetical protein
MVHLIKKDKISRTGRGIHKAGKHKSDFKSFDDFKSSLTYFPDINTDEWEKEVRDIYNDYKEKYEKGELTKEDAEEKAKGDSDALVEYDTEEPSATVYYYNYPQAPMDESEEGGDTYPHAICHYTDETQGDFEVEWHSTDAWRGYYEVTSKDWVNVHSDCILSMSEDAGDLEDFDEKLTKELGDMKVAYAKVFSRTSNVFSSGYDFFVQKKDSTKVKKIVNNLLKVHRDPEKFKFTALTGTDPSKGTVEDKVFVEFVDKLQKGEPMEKIIPEAIKKIKKMKGEK